MATDLSGHFWDCECEKRYINPRWILKCPVCGAERDNESSPDSMLDEILVLENHKDSAVFSHNQPLAAGLSKRIVDLHANNRGEIDDPLYIQVAISDGAIGTLTVALESAIMPDEPEPELALEAVVEFAKYQVDSPIVARGGIVLVAPLPSGCGWYLRLRYAGASGGTVTSGIVAGASK